VFSDARAFAVSRRRGCTDIRDGVVFLTDFEEAMADRRWDMPDSPPTVDEMNIMDMELSSMLFTTPPPGTPTTDSFWDDKYFEDTYFKRPPTPPPSPPEQDLVDSEDTTTWCRAIYEEIKGFATTTFEEGDAVSLLE
jgi:hypothetical protein